MNDKEKLACDLVAASFLDQALAAGLPVMMGGLGDPGIPCRVDVGTTQVGDMSIIKVRLSRRAHPTEGGSFPPSVALDVKNGIIVDEAHDAIRAFVSGLKRICRRADGLERLGIDYLDAPAWSFEMDEITRRLIAHSCGGELDIRQWTAAANKSLDVTYMPVRRRDDGTTEPMDAPLLAGIGDRLRIAEDSGFAFEQGDEQLHLQEEKCRLSIRGERLPATAMQWVSEERPDVSRVIGHPAFRGGCDVRVTGATVRNGWTVFDYERRTVQAAKPPREGLADWRDE